LTLTARECDDLSHALTIQILGGFVLKQNGQTIPDLDSPRLQSLLTCLLLNRGTPQLRRHLAFTFWPDSAERQARTNLRNLLYRLRRSWHQAHDCLAIENSSITWRTDADFWLDAAAFDNCLAEAENAVDPAIALAARQRAIDLYRGDLLPTCYDDWIVPQRERLRQAFLQALEQQVDLLQETGDHAGAIRCCLRLSEAEPLQESVWHRLMALYRLAGDRAAALHTYHRCAALLRQELDVEPGPATQEEYQRLLLPSGAEPVRSLPVAPKAATLIGRTPEWEQLHTLWQQTVSGTSPPSLVLIGGEAGIGKSRLAEEFVARVRQQGGVTAMAACYAPETTLSFAPVASWLRDLSLDALAPVWRTELARLLPELLPPDWPLMPPPFTEAWQKQRFHEALTRAVLSQKQPVCLYLDDIQWSDAETLAWLHYLLRRDTRARLLVLATCREGEADSEPLRSLLLQWRGQGRLPTIDLARLDSAESADLAMTILGQPLPSGLASALYRYTEGNPLFIVETVRSSLEQNRNAGEQADPLRQLARRLPADDAATAPLPPRILAVIRARLAQLSPPAQRTLEVATVIGRSFTSDILLQVSGFQEEQLVAAIDELWQRRIVRERETGTCDFSHDKLRQVAYDGISPARRRWLHGRVAQTLAALDPARPELLAGRIAFHYEAAGQATLALDCHQQAARAARQVCAFREAVFHLRRAIALLDRVPLAPPEQARLCEQLGDVLTLNGQHDEAREAYQTALTHIPPAPLSGSIALLMKQANTWLAQYALDTAWQQYQAALAQLPPVESCPPAQVQLWLEIRLKQLDVLYFQADLAGMAGMLTAIEPVVEDRGTLPQRIRFFQLRAQLHSRQTRFCHTEYGVACAQTALTLALETGDQLLQHNARFGFGFMLLWQDQPDILAAVEQLRQAEAGSRMTGNIPLQSRCLAYLAIAWRLLGQSDKLADLLPRCTAVARQEENGLYLAVAQANQAWLDYRAGHSLKAQTTARHALEQWHQPAFPFHWLACWPSLAAAVEHGDLVTAATRAREMLAPEQQRLPTALEAALTAAVADPAAAHFRQALTLARQHRML
jgi:DNA-binding SARP family transcriptional activator